MPNHSCCNLAADPVLKSCAGQGLHTCLTCHGTPASPVMGTPGSPVMGTPASPVMEISASLVMGHLAHLLLWGHLAHLSWGHLPHLSWDTWLTCHEETWFIYYGDTWLTCHGGGDDRGRRGDEGSGGLPRDLNVADWENTLSVADATLVPVIVHPPQQNHKLSLSSDNKGSSSVPERRHIYTTYCPQQLSPARSTPAKHCQLHTHTHTHTHIHACTHTHAKHSISVFTSC